ncbi:peptidase M23 [Burkholderia sp. SRS-W-2-2016]|uniref:M23 family metallopeptidase n=1 Tax=Burkholderia sp. SRS-W-2-2016 TaxID=1926878 RepID=UPI00094B6282|nr:M23 family metallopeptidase [Burkholderia sp. SRS-W-2-2016]OLL32387.1 peptidase M23 [Burkholderia sp. SRS-W-2-2016]
MSSVCAAYLVSHQRAWRDEEPDVSLVSKDSTRFGARAPNPAAAPAGATPTAPAAPAPAAPQPPPFTVRTAPIERTFAAAAKSMGVDAGTTAILSRAFHDELDLSRDLKPGDRVSAVFDNAANSASPANPADSTSKGNDHAAAREPLAVRIVRGAQTHDVFLHKDLSGKPFYYSKEGVSAGPVFERYPLNFTRVSSEFSLRRLDPVVYRWQSHDGVDLAAPTGTPVRATARGVIRFLGHQTGYGNVVKIQNPAPYSTTFAHLSRFAKGLHNGSHVKRNEVIGYVGETGWATGPHLHYEVHVNNVPRDPLKVDLPQKTTLNADQLKHFEARVAQLTSLL